MFQLHFAVRLMLTASILFRCLAVTPAAGHQHLHNKDFRIAARDESHTSTLTGPPCTGRTCTEERSALHLPCGEVNGTEVVGKTSVWTMLCDTDFFAQDIYPFILTKTFEECMQYCEDYNNLYGEAKCTGFVFAPDRTSLDNSCYLKSSLNNIISPATIHLIAATMSHITGTYTEKSPIPSFTSFSTTVILPEPTIVTPPKIGTLDPITGQNPKAIKQPRVVNSTYIGPSVDEVASHYVSHAPDKPQQLAAEMLEAGVNVNLIADFPLASDTGSWTSTGAEDYAISEMKVVPRLSRDGGRGGIVNGTNVFIFCDTSTFGKDKDPTLGYLNGFVSSSVAVDHSMNALSGKPLSLVNSLGQWQDDVGRLRGWVPMTTGEEAFNIAVSGRGYRYAVWPNASPIPLNGTHSIMHAPLVYLEVDMQDQSSPRYTSLGNTLLVITIDPIYGPHADRIQNQFFLQHEVSWGSLGGIRAWGTQGNNSLEGNIYVFGQAERGVLLGKVAAKNFDDRSKYTYWDGHSWSDNMPPIDSTSDAFMIDQPVMNMDLIYSPAHKTFIIIYLTPEADNTFYYRYLVDNHNKSLHIVPSDENGGSANFVEEILTNTWSEERILFVISNPERGYAYAGGLHAGYFGEDDITNGGTKMLCTWTEHTKTDPDKPESGYAHKSQIVELGFEA